jgi:hypothetical protein
MQNEFTEVAVAVIILDECGVFGRKKEIELVVR